MIEYYILITIAFLGLLIASFTDARTREVPDWLNFSLIAIGLGVRAIYSAATFDWMYFVEGLIGLAAAVALGYLMFYSGQWGGGDSKMLMGLGAVLGLQLSWNPLPQLIVFLANMLIIGAFYGLAFSFVLAIIHWKEFLAALKETMHDPKSLKLRKIALVSSLLLIVLSVMLVRNQAIMWLCISLTLLGYFSTYLVIVVKAVEKAAMFRFVSPEKLTEGEWIAQDYSYRGKHLCGPKDLGISKEQIKKLRMLKKAGKISKIKIKVGIPFVPSFLIAFVITLIFSNWWTLFL